MKVIEIIAQLVAYLPNLIRLINHYTEIVKSESFVYADKEKAKEILSSLRWKPFDEV